VASAVLGDRLPKGLPFEQARAHRQPTCLGSAPGREVVTVRLYDDHGSQAAHVAHQVRSAHVQRSVPWSGMAVLVRGGQQIPLLQRALSAAGVPAVVATDEIPLRSEPAVAALLAVVALAARPQAASPSDVLDVLTGPIVALSASDVRRLGRALRSARHSAGAASPPSDVLIRDLVLDGLRGEEGTPEVVLTPDDPIAVTIQRVRALLTEMNAQMTAGASPEDVLWTGWTGGRTPHGWPQRLRAAALAGSRSAHHDLDAVIALFDAAERLSGRYPGFLGIRLFLDYLAGQQIPAEPVADRGAEIDAVRVLTTHRAKGLEWDEVWVVGLEEGVWPDVRPRGSTLRAEELTSTGIGSGPRPADLLEEERRLLYVACTRARTGLHLSAVNGTGDASDRQSRFIDDICRGVPDVAVRREPGRPAHPLSLDGLVAELRTVLTDQLASSALRAAAAQRLALLASQRDGDGERLVPLGDPAYWWGLRPITEGPRSVRDPERPLSLSGSGLDGILACPMKWFLQHEARAEAARGPATSFGSVVHAVADFVAKGDVAEDLDAMDAQVERIWGELRFEARWQSDAERREARAALGRFLEYHVRRDRALVATEAEVAAEVVVPRPDGLPDLIRLRGFIDRVERDSMDRLVPIDLKNMRRGVPDADIPEHGQLGVYQLLLREGGLAIDRGEGTEAEGAEAEGADDPVAVGGAALVQLRVSASKGSVDPKVQFQDALGDESPSWIELKLGAAAQVLRTELFPACVGPQCRYCDFRTSCPAQFDGAQVVS
jgi:RecB family exonuclease